MIVKWHRNVTKKHLRNKKNFFIWAYLQCNSTSIRIKYQTSENFNNNMQMLHEIIETWASAYRKNVSNVDRISYAIWWNFRAQCVYVCVKSWSISLHYHRQKTLFFCFIFVTSVINRAYTCASCELRIYTFSLNCLRYYTIHADSVFDYLSYANRTIEALKRWFYFSVFSVKILFLKMNLTI